MRDGHDEPEGRFDPALIRALVDHVPSMLAYWDTEQRCRFANRAYQRWFGVTPESLLGTHIRELLGPLYELNLPYIERALSGEAQEFEREIPIPGGGGVSRHSLACYIPHVTDGAVRGFFVVVSDISALKRAQLALAESEARFSGIISISPDAIISVDERQRIALFNESAERIFGWARDEVLGRPLDLLLPGRFRELHRRHVLAFAAGADHGRSMAPDRPGVVGLRKDGTEFPAEASISRLQLGNAMVLTVTLRDITERRRIEDERQGFVALIENSPEFIGIADPRGRMIYVNPTGRRLVGLGPDEPIEQLAMSDFYAPADRQFATDVILRSTILRGRWSGETFYRHRVTGAAIPMLDEHFLIREPAQGRVVGVGTVSRDVTEARRLALEREEGLAREQRARRVAEEANELLRESEERFRLTIDEAPIGMALVAPDGRFVRVNGALCDIVGYAPEELTGLKFQAITHPDDLDADLALAGQLARGEIPRYQLAKRYVRRDGAVVDIMLSGSVVRGPDGVPLHFIAQIEDITERRRTEREWKLMAEAGVALASSLDYEQTLSTVAELVVRDLADWCIIDLFEEQLRGRRLRVVSANPSNRALAGRLERFSLDRSRPYLLTSVVETRQPLLLEEVAPAQLEAAAQSPEHLELLRAIAPSSLMAVPLLSRGELLGVMALVSSTPTRSYGPADLRLAGVLADRAAAALENARLYRAAVEATRLREQVLSVVAHDLRNPLSNVLLHATRLRKHEGRATDWAAGTGEAIERTARRMNRLIQDLLEVSRLEAGRLSIQRVRIRPGDVIAEVVATQVELARAAGLTLIADASSDLPEVWADRDRLLQAFENLVGNAVKFTREGGRITVGATPGEGEVVFRVADTGAGISAEDLPHVFDRFWQAEPSDRRGAGLGLAIVKGIVDAHGGRVEVESAPGQGSTFSFTIPTDPRPGARPTPGRPPAGDG